MKIVGYKNVSFKAKDGTEISGVSLFLTEPVDPGTGVGESTDKVFLSSAKLTRLGFRPVLGMRVKFLFDRYGKVAEIQKLDDPELEVD